MAQQAEVVVDLDTDLFRNRSPSGWPTQVSFLASVAAHAAGKHVSRLPLHPLASTVQAADARGGDEQPEVSYQARKMRGRTARPPVAGAAHAACSRSLRLLPRSSSVCPEQIARVLTRYIEFHEEKFRGTRVLELGAGVVRPRNPDVHLRSSGPECCQWRYAGLPRLLLRLQACPFAPRRPNAPPTRVLTAQGLTGIGAAAYGADVLLTDKVIPSPSYLRARCGCPGAHGASFLASQDIRLTEENTRIANEVGPGPQRLRPFPFLSLAVPAAECSL